MVSPGALRAPWTEALYYSGMAAATLGTGDIVPDLPALRLLAVMEALSGFALLSASLSYIMAIYNENGRKTTLAAELALHGRVGPEGGLPPAGLPGLPGRSRRERKVLGFPHPSDIYWKPCIRTRTLPPAYARCRHPNRGCAMKSPPVVLLVDRDTDTRDILRMYLEFRGYNVLEADDGEAALEMAGSRRPDLVIGDLPWDAEGRPPLSATLQGCLGADLPVIVYTSRALQQDVDAAARVGQRVLLKPMSPAAIFHTIQQTLVQGTRSWAAAGD